MKYRGWYPFALAVGLACIGAAVIPTKANDAVPTASSVVRVFHDAGHGSGVHIGNGLVLTAAHVVMDLKTVKLKTDADTEVEAEVLWASKSHDVALLKATSLSAGKSRLDCRALKIGEMVSANGNPGPLEFVTTWGRVAAGEKERSDWKSSVVIDATVAPGMSGGPVFDRRGQVVGIVVGVAVSQVGFSASFVPLTYIVPSTDVCRLLAR